MAMMDLQTGARGAEQKPRDTKGNSQETMGKPCETTGSALPSVSLSTHAKQGTPQTERATKDDTPIFHVGYLKSTNATLEPRKRRHYAGLPDSLP